jgi:hypothetical protein
MKPLRKKNPLIFDLVLFLAFTVASFAAYLLTEAAGMSGAIISIVLLSLLSVSLIISR